MTDLPRVTHSKQSLPVITGIEIPVDDAGRYNLNALHRASGEGQNKDPAHWLRNQQTRDFIQEIIDIQICISPVVTKKGGADQGTFAHELVAVEYAGWISPRFRIMVNQTFIDYRTGKLQPALPTDLPTALRLYADELERRHQAERELDAARPKVLFHDQVIMSEKAYTFTEVFGLLKKYTGQTFNGASFLAFLREQGIACQANPHSGVGKRKFQPRNSYIGQWFVSKLHTTGEVEWLLRPIAVNAIINLIESTPEIEKTIQALPAQVH